MQKHLKQYLYKECGAILIVKLKPVKKSIIEVLIILKYFVKTF